MPLSNRSEIDYWDEIYQSGEYRRHWDYAHPSPELVGFIASGLVPRAGVALDLGCGAGREAIFLARYGLRVIGIDISARALRIARGRARRAKVHVEWHQGSVFELPEADETIDLINDRGLLHLIPEKHRSRLAGEIRRVLKPGGALLIRATTRSAEHLVPVTARSLDRHFCPPGFSRSPLLPVQMHSDAGVMDGVMVVIRKT